MMAFRSHGASCCHPLTFPPGPLSLPLPCPLPGAQAECSVRRVSTERPLCVLTKAECPGDKRGRSGLRAHKASGRRGLEEVEGREEEGGNLLGAKYIHSAPKTPGTLKIFSHLPPLPSQPHQSSLPWLWDVQYIGCSKLPVCSQQCERRELTATEPSNY